LMLRSCRK